MADTVPLYDEAAALRELARARDVGGGPLTRAEADIASDVSGYIARHFTAAETGTAGRALLLAAASVGEMNEHRIPAGVISNILAFAAAQMLAPPGGEDGTG